MSTTNKYSGLEIAIIGMSGRFPFSKDHRQFWQNLEAGRELLNTFTDDELRESGVRESSLRDKRFVRTAGLLEGKDNFDAAFFGYTDEEASFMDPQVRLFHEHCYNALEDAAYTSETGKQKIGLFAGASLNENWKIFSYSRMAGSAVDPFYLQTITSQNFICSLVAYKLNLRGPVMYVDTACSTSLSAIHLACRSLLTRDCTMALAGGICLHSEKTKGYFYKEGMISSPDGHCRTFDAQANGTAWGEGVGVVVLKKLEDAMRDRDHIYAVIRSSYANNDGNAKVGYTAPAVKGQADCIAAAIKLAGVQPGSIGYIEAHGTATRLGDPVEVRALNEAFGAGGDRKFCAIGSVKSNVGHLDAAAGVAGLMKAAMSLYCKAIPPSLHFKEPNPEIDFEGGPFYVNSNVIDWQRTNGTPLRAGVSSFGIGGTNVHLVLEEAPPLSAGEWGHTYKLLTASAKTPSSLSKFLAELKQFVLEEPGLDLSAMAYTMQVGRQHHVFRHPIVFGNRDELITALTAAEQGSPIKSREKPDHCVFLFPGQGVQYIHMGKGLYEQEPVFREWMDKGFDVLEKLTGENFKDVLFPPAENISLVNDTKYTQPLIFLVEYSLARLLMQLGIRPKYMLGHSIGEYAAACISGVFDFDNALRLVVRRGALMNNVPPGAMISLPASAETAAAYLGKGISLAAVNAPEQVVLSGDHRSIDALGERLVKSGIQFMRLKTSHAFHSAMQDEILDEFRKEANAITYNAPSIPFISNVTGTFIKDEEAVSPEYWVRHLRETVKFHQGIQTLLSLKQKLTVMEAGPGAVLTGLFSQQPNGHDHNLTPMMRSAKHQEDDHRFLLKQLGHLWSQGITIDWSAWYTGRAGRRISLPGYSFEKERYQAEVNLFESGILQNIGAASSGNISDWIYYPSWKRTIPLTVAASGNDRRSFLLFCDNAELASNLQQALQHDGDEWTWVATGPYQMPGKDAIAITDIIYCRGLARNGNDSVAATEAFLDLARCVQSICNHNTIKQPKLTIVTGNLHKVTGTDNLLSTQALLQGIINVAPQELGWWCINVDIDMHEQADAWTGKLATEIRVNSTDRIVAWRQGQRWVQDFQKNVLPVTNGQSTIRQQGVYLVTGGLGNAGFELAKYLLKNYKATVVLTGRREPGQLLQRLDLLKNAGGEVRYYQADVSDLSALQSVVEETERNYGSIHGVIHAAGVLDRSLFEAVSDITPVKAMAMLAPKVKGIENLYALFGHRSPDFIWVLSSLSAILGGQGFAAYAAANSYMDHFVDARAAGHSCWKCLDLPGLVFTDEQAQVDHTAIGPSDLTSLLEWSLSFSGSHVIIVNKDDLAARIKKTFTYTKVVDEDSNHTVTERSKRNRPHLAVEYKAPVTETEMKLTAIFEDFFGMQHLGTEDPFFELGGDSLKAMILLSRIKTQFDVPITLQEFLFNSIITEIAGRIDELQWLKNDTKTEHEITI